MFKAECLLILLIPNTYSFVPRYMPQLYPRQSLLLAYLIQREITTKNDDSKTFRICETGFGSGHCELRACPPHMRQMHFISLKLIIFPFQPKLRLYFF